MGDEQLAHLRVIFPTSGKSLDKRFMAHFSHLEVKLQISDAWPNSKQTLLDYITNSKILNSNVHAANFFYFVYLFVVTMFGEIYQIS